MPSLHLIAAALGRYPESCVRELAADEGQNALRPASCFAGHRDWRGVVRCYRRALCGHVAGRKPPMGAHRGTARLGVRASGGDCLVYPATGPGAGAELSPGPGGRCRGGNPAWQAGRGSSKGKPTTTVACGFETPMQVKVVRQVPNKLSANSPHILWTELWIFRECGVRNAR